MNIHTQVIVFGGGCFWCTEAVFKMLKGVVSVEPGYSGGEKANPTYEEVSTGDTGHVEVTRVEYDPDVISVNDLLTVFFGSHDPTTKNRQGNDMGTQYRSVIFYTTPEQKEAARKFIHDINNSTRFGVPVVTTIEPIGEFYPAEEYHKDYFAKHPEAAYCALVINPKLEKVQKEFADLLKHS